MTVAATDRIVAAKLLKAAGLRGFRIRDAERLGSQLVVLLVLDDKYALTATLEQSKLTDLALGWPA